MADETADPAEMSFEDALKELESIVSRLESGQTTLEQSIDLYARGEKLKSRCEGLLKSAEMRIEKIRMDASGAASGTEPLDVER